MMFSNDAQTGKVLLLEDDTDSRNAIKEMLESHSYEVAAVRSGVEGLQKIMARDYDVILCDMMMRNLPGDMFYLAVRRTRPYLCGQFVFMMEHAQNQKTLDFVQKVNGAILNKPVHAGDLLDMIAYLQVRSNFDEDPDGASPVGSFE